MSSGSFADDAVERKKGRTGGGMNVLCSSCRFSPSCLGHSARGARRIGAAVVAAVACCFVLVPILRGQSTRFSLMRDDTSVGSVPRSWGAFAHGLDSLRNDWGGSHGQQPPMRSRRRGNAHVIGAPGLGADSVQHNLGIVGPQGDTSQGEGEHFGSAVGRALGEASSAARTGGLRLERLADEQKAVIAARNLVQHPLHTIITHASSDHHRHKAAAHASSSSSSSSSEGDRGMENKGSWLNASPWRRTHMAEAEERVERKERDEEAGMSRLRQVIRGDRRDLQDARDELKRSKTDLLAAKEEEVKAAQERHADTAEQLEMDKIRVKEMDLHRSVLHKVARSRARRGREQARLQHDLTVEQTLLAVKHQAHQESSEAMQLRSKALSALSAAHQLKKEAASLRTLGRAMEATAAADVAAAKRAVQAGRKRARQELAHAAKGARDKQSIVAAAAADAAKAEEQMKQQAAAAAALRAESHRYKHEAARLLIEADMQAARAPRDLAVASKVQSTAASLRSHVVQVEQALTAAHQLHAERQQQRQPLVQREQLRKRLAVQHLAQLKIEQEEEGAQLKEMQAQTAQVADKAASDRRAAHQRQKQALVSLNAARESEIEDEGRLHALQRRWRATQEQLGALDAVKPRYA